MIFYYVVSSKVPVIYSFFLRGSFNEFLDSVLDLAKLEESKPLELELALVYNECLI